jgi:hypothetical protein
VGHWVVNLVVNLRRIANPPARAFHEHLGTRSDRRHRFTAPFQIIQPVAPGGRRHRRGLLLSGLAKLRNRCCDPLGVFGHHRLDRPPSSSRSRRSQWACILSSLLASSSGESLPLLLLWPFGQAGLLSSVECCAICMSAREPIHKRLYQDGARSGPAPRRQTIRFRSRNCCRQTQGMKRPLRFHPSCQGGRAVC